VVRLRRQAEREGDRPLRAPSPAGGHDAAVCVIGLEMAWQAIECGFLRHHGHSMLCAIGVLINCITFEIA
jgi:hypothetical protein